MRSDPSFARTRSVLIGVVAIAALLLAICLILYTQRPIGRREVLVKQQTPAPPPVPGPNDYYITGSVGRSGIYTLRKNGTINVKQAIAAAGGVDCDMTTVTVTVTRRDAGGNETKPMAGQSVKDLFAGKVSDVDLQGTDLVYVSPPITGEYYMDGDVRRTGVYSLSGRRITLRQAIAAAGGLERGLADAEIQIIRRVDKNAPKIIKTRYGDIMSQDVHDLFLEPNDVIRIASQIPPATTRATTRG